MEIIGTGSCVPSSVVTNAWLAARVNTTDSWIREQLGVEERRTVSAELTSDLAVSAARHALAAADMTPADVRLLVVATQTPDRTAPATASIVQAKLGAWSAVAFDLAAVCSGFVFALTVARRLVDLDGYTTALVIGADTFSRITDYSSRDCVYFGDGAGAVVVRAGTGGHHVLDAQLYGDGHGHEAFTVPPGKGAYRMDARAVYQHATQALPAAITAMLEKQHLCMQDIAWIVPHQASLRVLQEVARKLDYPFEQVLTNMQHYGNTAAATVPMALDQSCRAGKFRPGELVLLAAVGGGWTWGVMLLEW